MMTMDEICGIPLVNNGNWNKKKINEQKSCVFASGTMRPMSTIEYQNNFKRIL